MGKIKLAVLVIIIVFIIGVVAGLYFAGAFEEGGIAKLLVGGKNVSSNFMSNEEKQLAIECNDPNCLFEKFNQNCEKSYGEVPIPEEEMLVYVEVAGEENGQCIMNVKLLDANGQAAFAKGLDATCLIAPKDVNTIQENFNINDLNCEGPLYEAAKIAQ